MTKAEIRRRIAGEKKAVGRPALEAQSAAALERLLSLDAYKSARTIGSYVPLPDEVDIAPLLSDTARRFFIPAFDEQLGSYRMARYTPELRQGKFGIPEPARPVFADQDEIDLIIVPGIAFDRAGRRVGRGGGFYDRLLPLYSAVRVGLCFDFQCLEAVPAEFHDCRMDLIVTDTQIFKVYDER